MATGLWSDESRGLGYDDFVRDFSVAKAASYLVL